LKEPKITEQIDSFVFEWPAPQNLIAKVSRVRISSDGQVKGELEIRWVEAGKEVYLLVSTHFNFSSEPTRNKFAKQLSEKLALKIEWREILDYLARTVQNLVRLGDTCIEVRAENNTPPPEQLLDRIIYKGVQNIIFGEKGVSKSTLAYLLTICVVLPWGDNPLNLKVPEKPVKALILDWESDETIFRYYLSRLQRGMNLPICSLFYRRCNLPLIDDIEAIQKYIESTGAELLVIDSLGAAAGGERGELKGSESALLFNSALRKLKTTSLIIGQTRKGDDDKKKTIFGSTYFTYYARNIFELYHGHENYEDTEHLALFHRECNLGKKMPPMGLRIDFNNTTGGINIEREAISIAEFVEKVSVSMRILEILKGGAMSQKELKETTEASYASVGMALKRLNSQGKVWKVDKKWGLKAFGGRFENSN